MRRFSGKGVGGRGENITCPMHGKGTKPYTDGKGYHEITWVHTFSCVPVCLRYLKNESLPWTIYHWHRERRVSGQRPSQ